MNQAVLFNLKEARKLIQKGWYQGGPTSPDGTRFCALGAIWRINRIGSDTSNAAEKAIEECVPAFHNGCVAQFNDAKRRRKKDVVNLFTKAIRKLSRKKQ